MATTGGDGWIDVWDVITHSLLWEASTGRYGGNQAVISQDSTYVAVALQGPYISLYNTYTGANIWFKQVLDRNINIDAVAFSADGKKIFFCSDNGDFGATTIDGIVLFRVKVSTNYLNNLVISPDGRTAVMAGGDQNVWFVDTATGANQNASTGHTSRITGLAMSSTGTAYSSSSDQTVRRWNSATGASLGAAFNIGQYIDAMALSPNGTNLALTFSSGVVQMYNATTGASGAKAASRRGAAQHCLTFSSDGSSLYASGDDSEYAQYKSADLTYVGGLGRPNNNVSAIAWTSDEQGLMNGDWDTTAMTKWSSSDLHQISRTYQTGRVSAVVSSSDGKYTALGVQNLGVRLITNATGTGISFSATNMGNVNQLAFTSDNSNVVSASQDNTARVWSLAGSSVGSLVHGNNTQVTSVAVSGPGSTKLIATGDNSGNVIIWNGSNYAKIRNLPTVNYSIGELAFTPDGKSLLMQYHTSIAVIDLSTGKVSRTLAEANGYNFTDFDLSRDGKTVCAGTQESTLVFFSLVSGTEFTFSGLFANPVAVRYSPKGDLIGLALNYGQIVIIGNPNSVTSTAIVPDSFGAMGGKTVLLRAYLSSPAPSTGTALALTSNSTSVTVPAQLYVRPGEQFAEFIATVSPVANPATISLSATISGLSATCPLVVLPPILRAVTFTDSSIKTGLKAIGTITLAAPAPTGGTSIALSSSSSAATVPASVVVPAGATSVTFTLTTKSGLTSRSVVTVTAGLTRVLRTGSITVVP